ncbi:MAG: DNA polymerase III subunit chi [Thioploca sp.]|nr:DNA polymerase III subunit chi [Thioploca sp.]
MPQIDFYILHTPVRSERDRLACRLVDKAWHQGYRVYIHTPSLIQAKQLDDLLWTFKDTSFLPHDIYPDVLSSSAPIRIGYTDQVCETMEVLVNLTVTVPAFFAQAKRIAEIVDDTAMARETGRDRYRFYQKTADNVLKVHEIYR